MILFKYYGEWFELPSNMATCVTKNRKFDQKINKKKFVKCQLLANFGFGWSLFTFDDLAYSTFKMAINNGNVVVFGMKQHCDMKIQFSSPGRSKFNICYDRQ